MSYSSGVRAGTLASLALLLLHFSGSPADAQYVLEGTTVRGQAGASDTDGILIAPGEADPFNALVINTLDISTMTAISGPAAVDAASAQAAISFASSATGPGGGALTILSNPDSGTGPDITSDGNGIFAEVAAGATANLVIDVTGPIEAGRVTDDGTTSFAGIVANQQGSGTLEITAGDITMPSGVVRRSGIVASRTGGGPIAVTANGTINAGTDGINLSSGSTFGTTAVTVNGAIVAGDDGLDLSGISGGAVVSLGPGASVRTTGTTEFNHAILFGSGSDRLILSEGGQIRRDDPSAKGVDAGAGARDVLQLNAGATGTQSEDATLFRNFEQLVVKSGADWALTGDANFGNPVQGNGGGVIVEAGAKLSLTGNLSVNSGFPSNLQNQGTVVFNGTARQIFSGGSTGDGTIIVSNTEGVEFRRFVGANLSVAQGGLATLRAGADKTIVSDGTTEFDLANSVLAKGLVSGTGTVRLTGAAIVTFEETVSVATTEIRNGRAFFEKGAGAISFTGGASDTQSARFTTRSQTVTGPVSTSADGIGEIEINVGSGNSVTFQGAVGSGRKLGSFLVAAGSTARFDKAGNSLSTLNFATGSTIELGDGIQLGDTVLTVSGLAPIAGKATVVAPRALWTGAIGQTVTLMTDAEGHDISGTLSKYELVEGGRPKGVTRLEMVSAGGGADRIDIRTVARPASEVQAEYQLTAEQTEILLQASRAMVPGGEVDGAMQSVFGADNGSVAAMADQLGMQKEAALAVVDTTILMRDAVRHVLSDRLAAQRSDDKPYQVAGWGFTVAESSRPDSASVWMRPIAVSIDQGTRDSVRGYDATTTGIAFGGDMPFAGDWGSVYRLGIAGSYARSDLDGKGVGATALDITGWQASLYGDVTTDLYYVEAFAGVGRSDYDGARQVNFGGLDRRITSSYTGDQMSAGLSAGVPFDLGNRLSLTPEATLDWIRIDTDAYTEQGGGGISLAVEADQVDRLVVGANATLEKAIPVDAGMLYPSARLGIGYDVVGDAAGASVRFIGGGTPFRMEGAEPAPLSSTAGFALSLETGPFTLGAAYDAEFRESYLAHRAGLELKYSF